MPTIPTYFNWGKPPDDNPELFRKLDEAYNKLAQAINVRPSRYVTDGVQRPNVDPPASSQFNQNWGIGDIYVRTDTNKAWIMTSRTTDIAVTWSEFV